MRPTSRLQVVNEEGQRKKKVQESEKEQIERLRLENDQLRLKMQALKRETQKKDRAANGTANASYREKDKEEKLRSATNRLKYVHRENEKTLKDIKRAEQFKKKAENTKLSLREHEKLKEVAIDASLRDFEVRRERASSVRNMRVHAKEAADKKKQATLETAKTIKQKEREERERLSIQNEVKKEQNKHLVLEVTLAYRDEAKARRSSGQEADYPVGQQYR